MITKQCVTFPMAESPFSGTNQSILKKFPNPPPPDIWKYINVSKFSTTVFYSSPIKFTR